MTACFSSETAYALQNRHMYSALGPGHIKQIWGQKVKYAITYVP